VLRVAHRGAWPLVGASPEHRSDSMSLQARQEAFTVVRLRTGVTVVVTAPEDKSLMYQCAQLTKQTKAPMIHEAWHTTSS
jgi:hypothetical protein